MKFLRSVLLTLPIAACGMADHDPLKLGSLTGGPAPETRSLEMSIQPVNSPSRAEFSSMTVKSLLDGETSSYTVSRYGNGVRVREGSGCVWTRARDWFSPSDSWANCGTSKSWHTAQASVRILDPLYPLEVGSTGSYERRAVSLTGDVSVRETRCEVISAVEVLRPGRTATPAYVVECDDGRRTRTTWYAPGEGPVAFREEHRSRGVEEAWVRAD